MNRAGIPAANQWENIVGQPPVTYACGYCGNQVASALGWHVSNKQNLFYIRVCPQCKGPTFWDNGLQQPGVAFGSPVRNVPTDIDAIYNEARLCYSASAYTAAVLLLRKLLMNVAVDVGAKPNQTFVGYVEHLAEKGYVPPNGKGWVDHIRMRGNEATHEIRMMGELEARELIVFAEMLLKFIYEFPKSVPQQP